MTESDLEDDLGITLPGYEPKDFKSRPSLAKRNPRSCERRKTEKNETEKCLWTEFQADDMSRRFNLPVAMDVSRTWASLEKGMLHITAAKIADGPVGSVEIRAV